MCVSAHTHAPYTFSTPRKWQGIRKKEERQPAFKEGPLFLQRKFQKSNRVLLQLKVTAPMEYLFSRLSLQYQTDHFWERMVQGL